MSYSFSAGSLSELKDSFEKHLESLATRSEEEVAAVAAHFETIAKHVESLIETKLFGEFHKINISGHASTGSATNSVIIHVSQTEPPVEESEPTEELIG